MPGSAKASDRRIAAPTRRIPGGGSPLITLLWGVFCACSWTWCIGMFLPKILIERYGPFGFLAFAVPNVLGCAGFGYVLKTADRSRRMVAGHGPAMVIFSLVAIAFQMFFVVLVLSAVRVDAAEYPWFPLAGALAVFVIARLLSAAGDRGWLLLAAVTWGFSVTAFGAIGFGAWDQLLLRGPRPFGELAWLAPVIGIGFLLCPYLDLTFHRALQRSPSRHAFGVFGVTFSVMIVFTAFLWFSPSPTLIGIGLGHVMAQITFTVGAHLRELREAPVPACPIRRRVYSVLPVLAALILPVARLVSDAPDLDTDLYLRFLVFYGLAFPAYVLVFVGPAHPLPLGRRALAGFIIALLLIAPFLEGAFVHDAAWLAIVPVVVGMGWLLMRSRR